MRLGGGKGGGPHLGSTGMADAVVGDGSGVNGGEAPATGRRRRCSGRRGEDEGVVDLVGDGSCRRQGVTGDVRNTGEMWGCRSRHSAARKKEVRVLASAQDRGDARRPRNGGGDSPWRRRRSKNRGGVSELRRAITDESMREREGKEGEMREGSSAETMRGSGGIGVQ